MNKHRLDLMSTMLGEVIAGTWVSTNTVARKKSLLAGVHYGLAPAIDDKQTRFNLALWADNELSINYEEQTKNDEGEPHCGFSACAVGHAMLDKRFNKLGLKAFVQKDGSMRPSYEDSDEWMAVREFFKIDDITATTIFSPMCYPESLTPMSLATQVKRRVDKLLEIGEIEFIELDLEYNEKMISPSGKLYTHRSNR